MSALPHRYFTPEEYLLLENQAAHKSQYVAGEIYSMAGTEPEHTEIVGNIVFALNTLLGERPRKVYFLDQRVKVADAELYTYPDVVAFCGGGQYDRSSRPAMLPQPADHLRGSLPFHRGFRPRRQVPALPCAYLHD